MSPITRGGCLCGVVRYRIGSDQISIWAGGIDGPTGLHITSQWRTESRRDYYELPDASIVRSP